MHSCRRPRRALALVLPFALLATACGDDAPKPAVSISEPADGATVTGGVQVKMTAKGITIEPAGDVHENAGHFHLIADDGCLAAGTAVPRDATHVHLGKGQTEGTIYLAPGAHQLCLQVGNGAHISLAATDTVTVTVGIKDRAQWCDVAQETDELFTATDNSSDEFSVKQVAYENIRRLIAQLSAAIDQVDASVRTDVAGILTSASTITSLFADAQDAQSAESALSDQFGSEGVKDNPAATKWILDTCGVDVSS
jgi:hypothetical protein